MAPVKHVIGVYAARSGGNWFLARSSSSRRARFTDSESLKTLAMSASRNTTLVPALYCSWCFPRTPREKSYSGLISSPLAGLPRLIVSPFLRRGLSRANEADTPLTLSIRYDQEAPRFGASYAHESELFSE